MSAHPDALTINGSTTPELYWYVLYIVPPTPKVIGLKWAPMILNERPSLIGLTVDKHPSKVQVSFFNKIQFKSALGRDGIESHPGNFYNFYNN